MKKEEVYYLYSCEFAIKIVFSPGEFPQAQNRTRNILFFNRKNLFISEPKHIDYEINFVDFKGDSFLIYQKNISYMQCARRVGTKKTEVYYHLNETQFNIILVDIFEELLAQHNGFLLHASATAIDGKALLFSGPSGVGKSTIVKLIKKISLPLSDDLIAVKKIGKKLMVYQTPFAEKNVVQKNTHSYPLHAILLLKHDKKCTLVRSDSLVAHDQLLSQLIVKKNNAKLQKRRLFSSIAHIALFDYGFSLNRKSVEQSMVSLMNSFRIP